MPRSVTIRSDRNERSRKEKLGKNRSPNWYKRWYTKIQSSGLCCSEHAGPFISTPRAIQGDITLAESIRPTDCEPRCNGIPGHLYQHSGCSHFSHSVVLKDCVICAGCDFKKALGEASEEIATTYTSWQKHEDWWNPWVRRWQKQPWYPLPQIPWHTRPQLLPPFRHATSSDRSEIWTKTQKTAQRFTPQAVRAVR